MRKLKRGQYWTTHDGSKLWRHIESVQPDRPVWVQDGPDPEADARMIGRVSLVYYWTNRGRDLHRCTRHTFVDWLRDRKARKTQKGRLRKL